MAWELYFGTEEVQYYYDMGASSWTVDQGLFDDKSCYNYFIMLTSILNVK